MKTNLVVELSIPFLIEPKELKAAIKKAIETSCVTIIVDRITYQRLPTNTREIE
jgi:hypothetical protein